MKRILKNSVYFAVIAGIVILGSRSYAEPQGTLIGDKAFIECEKKIKNAEFRGTNEREKVSNLADCINIVHGENISVSGFYDQRSNWVEYEVNLDFERADTVADFTALKDAEKRIIGELATTTARLLVPDLGSGKYSGAGIEGMKISVSKIHVSRRSSGSEEELFFEDAPFLQPGRTGEAYFFQRDGLEKLAKEPNSFNWEIYQSPSTWSEGYPRIGTPEEPKPQPSDRAMPIE
ncbi:MAG: hypothetical protein A3B96_04295 [Candidatus Spechtbacteria bacterium RIFCSPHIGHO2_02_FULL_43_15b]|uniref:Uncharacterized protein n=1 Tax=Candidatus Spechtbacteria bacterium RIFCSPHIGHO2_01_FULL_43_30 TaxID=1802158 RepID=A0A1G2H7H3_9BACT|nr:MAG: hypothetical protein A2827_01860 [Candidatus Spechtbacteria bacterium RIFCSPHIGHO2_01_FULL_43_30]OGZ58555.1 MAG: hypothetical protein A3B96_04295 [Candidatus Spechtbacteria bacterium RIFCSPHIGHO2_02_FULL_43_15b]